MIDPHGYEAGKTVKGRKRCVLVDTQGFPMQAIVLATNVQERDGGMILMVALLGLFPFLSKLYANSGSQGARFQAWLAVACRQMNLEIVRRPERCAFVVLHRCWIVERTIGWLNRCRRVAKDRQCLKHDGRTFP